LLLITTKVKKILQPSVLNDKKAIAETLQKEILLKEGYKPLSADRSPINGLEAIEAAFPNQAFPTGAIHEFLSFEPEHAAATYGFIGGLMDGLMKHGCISIWISAAKQVFPAALKTFVGAPDQIIFIHARRDKDALWAAEEALKCKGIACVILEVRELTFMQSRRLQLAVETSRVTGFVLRSDPRRMCTTACVARWHITPRQSRTKDKLPGVGFPCWQVDLQKARNGKPGKWQIEWAADRFALIEENKFIININRSIKIAG
jgi:protein ImuA